MGTKRIAKESREIIKKLLRTVPKNPLDPSEYITTISENNYLAYYYTDHLGSTRAIQNGSKLTKMDYAPFGEDFNPNGGGYKFSGKEDDVSTGLYYFNARYYDPAAGRFITEDPAKDGGNWYLYCGNNPLRYVDLKGLNPGDPFESPDLAAEDFARIYANNEESINKNFEWFAYIYKMEDGQYSYGQLQESDPNETVWNPDPYSGKYNKVAAIHSHACFRDYGGDNDLRFSTEDMAYAFASGKFYLANPAGELLLLDPKGYTGNDGRTYYQISKIYNHKELPKQLSVPDNLTGYHPVRYKEHTKLWKLFHWFTPTTYIDRS